ncbi:MAG TPA: GNAT family N-acetyltransferase [Candidatus Baltobacteraceae bacterium]|nr:GNAT family N-acetyltransferase [Candidatus Baltobacteraceae bacterium]
MTDHCPVLNAKLTILRPLIADHADALFPILHDQELWRYTPPFKSKIVAALRERYSRLESRFSPDGKDLWLNWAMERREDGQLVGFVQATLHPEEHVAEIAYVVGRSFWRRGLATDAVDAMLAFLRDDLQVHTARASVDSRNVPSIKLLERLDFHIENEADRSSVWFVKSLHLEKTS